MTKILFVCHGNICRSPMAEFVLKDMVRRAGIADGFEIASAATSFEVLGNPVCFYYCGSKVFEVYCYVLFRIVTQCFQNNSVEGNRAGGIQFSS